MLKFERKKERNDAFLKFVSKSFWLMAVFSLGFTLISLIDSSNLNCWANRSMSSIPLIFSTGFGSYLALFDDSLYSSVCSFSLKL